jgi:hypothetical protein
LIAKSVCSLLIGALLINAAIMGDNIPAEEPGAEVILINGAKMRDVHFPHHGHQNALGACDLCHGLFPAHAGSITKLKAQGIVRKKQVMEEHCIGCAFRVFR